MLGMGLDRARLKQTLRFEQMDRSPMRRNACELKTEKVQMGMGEHWEKRAFIVAPVQYLLVLGIKWLCKTCPISIGPKGSFG